MLSLIRWPANRPSRVTPEIWTDGMSPKKQQIYEWLSKQIAVHWKTVRHHLLLPILSFSNGFNIALKFANTTNGQFSCATKYNLEWNNCIFKVCKISITVLIIMSSLIYWKQLLYQFGFPSLLIRLIHVHEKRKK